MSFPFRSPEILGSITALISRIVPLQNGRKKSEETLAVSFWEFSLEIKRVVYLT